MPQESDINFSMSSDENRKSAMVGVVGRTNAGKSTVVNRMVGEKVSIVSPVVQTTRNTIRGIVEDDRGQLVLLDTPGLHKAVGHLGKLLNGMARASSAGVDILLVVFDAAHAPQLEDRGWMERVSKECPEKCVFALNKCDKAPFFETMFRDMWKEVASMRGEECTCNPIWVKTSGVRENFLMSFTRLRKLVLLSSLKILLRIIHASLQFQIQSAKNICNAFTEKFRMKSAYLLPTLKKAMADGMSQRRFTLTANRKRQSSLAPAEK